MVSGTMALSKNILIVHIFELSGREFESRSSLKVLSDQKVVELAILELLHQIKTQMS